MGLIKMTKVANTKENFAKCACGNCPSYNDCMNKGKEKLYCAIGKSKCKFDKNGCICGSCPVHAENKLDSGYYCASGIAK